MTDQTLLDHTLLDLAGDAPLPDPDRLAPARDNLLATITGTPRPGRRRLAVLGTGVVGLAAAITAVVALGALEQVGVAPPPASAAEILDRAADAARAEPDPVPRPDQFLYVRSQRGETLHHEMWLSVNGVRDGRSRTGSGEFVLPGCRNGRQAVYKGDLPLPGVTEPCVPAPAYLPDLPTDKQGMLGYIDQHLTDTPGDVNAIGKNIYELAGMHHLRPAALAALLEAVTEVEGLTVVPDAKDGAGRPGIGVRWQTEAGPYTMVFDKESYAFLGMSEFGALMAKGFVNEVGERP